MKKKNEEKHIQQQLGINNRKTIEERGRQLRPTIFTDRRAKSRSEVCDKRNVDKEILEI